MISYKNIPTVFENLQSDESLDFDESKLKIVFTDTSPGEYSQVS